MGNEARKTFFASGVFNVPAGVNRVRAIADTTAFSRMACENSASYMLDAFGQVYSWGGNGAGQLGQGNITSCSSPIAVAQGVFKFHAIFAIPGTANNAALALDTYGQLWSWGSNNLNLLGQGQAATLFSNSSPILVAGSGIGGLKTQYTNVFPSLGYIAAIDTNANAWMWGYNGAGNLGNGTNTAASSPIMVIGGIQWQAIDVSGPVNTLGLDVNGNAWAWGPHAGGATGAGLNTGGASSPVLVLGGITFKKILGACTTINTSVNTAGQTNFGLDTKGQVWTWGYNLFGQAGVAAPYSTAYSSPVLVTFPSGIKITDIKATVGSVSEGTFYALDTNGNLWSWGQTGKSDVSGSLGAGATGASNGSSTPTMVVGGHRFINFWVKNNYLQNAVGQFVYAQDYSGQIWSWGSNINGVLGNLNGTLNQSVPVAVSGAKQIVWMEWDNTVPGPAFACDIYGQLWSWGINAQGSAGNGTAVAGTATSSPVAVSGAKIALMANPQSEHSFNVTPGQAAPLIMGGMFTQFLHKIIGPIQVPSLPRDSTTFTATPLTLIANRVTVEYDQ